MYRKFTITNILLVICKSSQCYLTDQEWDNVSSNEKRAMDRRKNAWIRRFWGSQFMEK